MAMHKLESSAENEASEQMSAYDWISNKGDGVAENGSRVTAATTLSNFYKKRGFVHFYMGNGTDSKHDLVTTAVSAENNDLRAQVSITQLDMTDVLTRFRNQLGNIRVDSDQLSGFLEKFYSVLMSNKLQLASAITLDQFSSSKIVLLEIDQLLHQLKSLIATGISTVPLQHLSGMLKAVPARITFDPLAPLSSVAELFILLKSASFPIALFEKNAKLSDGQGSHVFQVVSQSILDANHALPEDSRLPVLLVPASTGYAADVFPLGVQQQFHACVILDTNPSPTSGYVQLVASEIASTIQHGALSLTAVRKPSIVVTLEACAQSVGNRITDQLDQLCGRIAEKMDNERPTKHVKTLSSDIRLVLEKRGAVLTSYATSLHQQLVYAAELSTVDILMVYEMFSYRLQAEPLVLQVVVRTCDEISEFVNKLQKLLTNEPTTFVYTVYAAENTSNALSFYHQLHVQPNACNVMVGWNLPIPLTEIIQAHIRWYAQFLGAPSIYSNATEAKALEMMTDIVSHAGWPNTQTRVKQFMDVILKFNASQGSEIHKKFIDMLKRLHTPNLDVFSSVFSADPHGGGSFSCEKGLVRMSQSICKRGACIIVDLKQQNDATSDVKLYNVLLVAAKLIARNVPVWLVVSTTDELNDENVAANLAAELRELATAWKAMQMPFLQVPRPLLAPALHTILFGETAQSKATGTQEAIVLIDHDIIAEYRLPLMIIENYGASRGVPVRDMPFTNTFELCVCASEMAKACFTDKTMLREFGDKIM